MWWSKDDENGELKIDKKGELKYHYLLITFFFLKYLKKIMGKFKLE